MSEAKSSQEPILEKSAESFKRQAAEVTTVKVDTRKLDTLMNLAGELVTVRAQFDRLVSLFNEEIESQKALFRLLDGMKIKYDELTKEVRHLFNAENHEEVSHISKSLQQLQEDFGSINQQNSRVALLNRIHSLDETTGSLGKIASDIQSGVMQTRMVPIEGVFTRFKRIVRDISKDINKQVNLVIAGEETELDKKLVDSLGDPLTHMIRNACDHGIESPEARLKVGKPEIGTVNLRASHKGNNICIEIGDDGKGLDPEAMVQNALKKGIIAEEESKVLSEYDKLNLIFLPGFSTAEKVTDLSGRGVGMDVVKNMITAVNGVVDIDTELGKGTTFILKIPLTLAIIQALLVVVAGEVYAFPLEAVTEIIKVAKEEIYAIDGGDTVKLRDHALSLVELEQVIQIRGESRNEQKVKRVVVITDGESQIGVQVDSLIGESEIVIKPLSGHFTDVRGVSGATILGDGQVALILDPMTIISMSK